MIISCRVPNVMRRSVEEARPDLDGVYLLEIIVSSRRVLLYPLSAVFKPKEYFGSKKALADAIERVDAGFSREAEKQEPNKSMQPTAKA